MKEKVKGQLVVVFILTIISMTLGSTCAITHIGEETSNLILPISLTDDNKIETIDKKPVEEIIIPTTQQETEAQKIEEQNETENIIDEIINKNITVVKNNTNNTTNNTNTTTNNTTNDTTNNTYIETPPKDLKYMETINQVKK